MPSDAAPWAATRRLHPWSVLFLLAGQLRQFAVPVVIALVLGSRSRETAWQIYTLPLLVPYTLFVVVRYLTFNYTFGNGELVIRSGLFFKNERHVPYSRIQNVEAVQNAMHRLLGVVDVQIDTGSGAETDATLSVVSRPVYEEIRRRVLDDRSLARGAGSAPRSADRTILALRPRDLAVLGLIENRAAVLVGAVLGLLWEMGMLERAIRRVGIDVAGPRGPASPVRLDVPRWHAAVRRPRQGGRRDRRPADRAAGPFHRMGYRAVARVPADARWRRCADRVRPAHPRVGDGAAAPHSDVDGPPRAHSSLVRSGVDRGRNGGGRGGARA